MDASDIDEVFAALGPVLKDWWPSFPGPCLHYPGRRLAPPPLRAFVAFVRTWSAP